MTQRDAMKNKRSDGLGLVEYWVGAPEWLDEELTRYSVELVRRIRRGTSSKRNEEAADCKFLFALSQRSLPDIRGNHFWPSAYQEVMKRSQSNATSLTQQQFIRYFRDAILATYRVPMLEMLRYEIHNRFVALVFQQAGVGKDRNHILRKFLEYLVEGYALDSREPSVIVRAALDAFVGQEPESARGDIRYLSGVLTRIAEEFIVLAHAIENEPRREEMLSWNWDQLRDFWISRGGYDLNDLTPSAATVLREIVSRLAVVWPRKVLMRLIKLGRIGLHLPAEVSGLSCVRYPDIPIGPADISHRGVRRSVLIVDRSELTPSALSAYEKDTWHWIGGDYVFKVSEHAFEVSLPHMGRQFSVPIFQGNSASDATRIGYFWGGHVSAESFSEGNNLSGALRVSGQDKLRIQYGFKWRNDRLFIELKGFFAGSEVSGQAELAIAKLVVWQGRLQLGRPERFVRKWIDLERLSVAEGFNIKVELECEDREVVSTTLSLWPPMSSGFLVSERRLFRGGTAVLVWARPDEVSRVFVCAKPSEFQPVASNLTYEKQANLHLWGVEFDRWALNPLPGKDSQFRLGPLWWRIESARPIEFSYPDEQNVVVDGVLISGAGNIRIVGGLSDLKVNADDASVFSDQSWGFWVKSNETEEFIRIGEDSISGSSIAVGRAMLNQHFDNLSGVIEIAPGSADAKSAKVMNFFVAPLQAMVARTRIDHHSRVAFSSCNPSFEVESSSPVTLAAFLERKKVRASYQGSDWEVWFQWQPEILDISLGGAFCSDTGNRFLVRDSARQTDTSRLDVRLYASDHSLRARISIAGRAIEIQPDTDFDISSIMPAGADVADEIPLELTVPTDGSALTWLIDRSPRIGSIDADAVRTGNRLIMVTARVSVTGVTNEILTIESVASGGVAESHELVVALAGTEVLEASFALACVRVENEEVIVRVTRKGVVIGKVSVPVDDRALAVERDSLETLLRAYKKTASPHLLPLIVEQLVLLFEDTDKGKCALRSIIPQVGGTGVSDEELWLITALKSLDYLTGTHPRNVTVPDTLSASAELRVMAISLWILLAAMYAERGVLIPASLEKAMQQLTRALAEQLNGSVWIRDFGCLAFFYAVDLSSRYGLGLVVDPAEFVVEIDLHKGDLEAARAMANISTDFKRRLEFM